jgi:hypothetical protein
MMMCLSTLILRHADDVSISPQTEGLSKVYYNMGKCNQASKKKVG